MVVFASANAASFLDAERFSAPDRSSASVFSVARLAGRRSGTAVSAARRLRMSRAARAATSSRWSSDPTSAREGSYSTCAGAGALRPPRWTPRNGPAAVHRVGVRTAPRRRCDVAKMPSPRACGPALEEALATTRTPTCTDAGALTHAIVPGTRPPTLQTPTARPATAARRVRSRRNARSRENARRVRNAATPGAGPRSARTRDARLATPHRRDARETRGRFLSRLDARGSSLARAPPPQLMARAAAIPRQTCLVRSGGALSVATRGSRERSTVREPEIRPKKASKLIHFLTPKPLGKSERPRLENDGLLSPYAVFDCRDRGGWAVVAPTCVRGNRATPQRSATRGRRLRRPQRSRSFPRLRAGDESEGAGGRGLLASDAASRGTVVREELARTKLRRRVARRFETP